MSGATLTQSSAQKTQQQLIQQQTQNLRKQQYGDFGTEYKVSPSTLNDLSTGSTPVNLGDLTDQSATHDAWNSYYQNIGSNFTQVKPENITIKLDEPKVEIPLSVQVPIEEAPQMIQQELNYEQ